MTATKPKAFFRRVVVEWLGLLMTLLAMASYIGYSKYHEYVEIESQQRARLTNQTAVIEKHLVPQLFSTSRALDGILDSMPNWQRENDGFQKANQRLKIISDTLSGIRTILIIDAKGRALASNRDELVGGNFFRREYFQNALKNPKGQTLFVTPPFETTLHSWGMSVYRVIPGPNREFAGIVIASVNPSYFNTLLDSVRDTPDMSTYLAHGDGKLFMMAPVRIDLIGENLLQLGSIFSTHVSNGNANNLFTERLVITDATPRLIALRTIQPDHLHMDKSLIVGVSRDLVAIFADWRHNLYTQSWIYIVLVLMTAVSLCFYQQRRRVFQRLAHSKEQALRASDARLHSFFDATPDALLISDEKGVITMANQQVERLLGYSIEELIGKAIDELVPNRFRGRHPTQRSEFSGNPSARRMGNGLAVKALRKDGSECDVEVSLSRIETDEGLFFASAMRDITERNRSEEQLRIAAVAFESHQGVVVTSTDDVILRVNSAFTKLTGYSAEESVGQKLEFLRSGRHDEHFWAEIWETVVRDGSWEGEVWNRNKSGDVHPYWLTMAAVKNRNNVISHYIETYTDISEKKQALAALQASEAWFRGIFEYANVGIASTDKWGKITSFNESFRAMLGFDAEALEHMNVADFTHPDDRNIEHHYIEEIHSRRRDNYQLLKRYMTRDARMLRVDLSVTAIRDAQGSVTNYVGVTRDITERLEAESNLMASENRLRTIIEHEPDCIKIVDAQGRLIQINPAGLAMIEADSFEQVAGLKVLDVVAPEYQAAFADLHRRVIAGESVRLKFKVLGLKGGYRWMDTHAVPMQDHGKPAQLAVTRDITASQKAEADLRIAAAAFESQHGMVVTDAHSVILRVNRAFTEITGYSAEDAIGQTPGLLKSGRHDAEFYRSMWESIHRTGKWEGEIWDRRKNGDVYPKWLTISSVKNDDGAVTHYIGAHLDVSDRKKAEEKISVLAFFDQLTGLPNRTLLLDRLKQAMTASGRGGTYGALLFIDLDHFKTLNDTLGHDMGDLLLQQVAQRLTFCVREGDTVARLGGDEFVVILTNLSTSKGDAASDIETVAEKILTALNDGYQLGAFLHRNTASIGATLFRGQTTTVDDLLKQADLAMYRAKEVGRNALRFFDPDMQTAVLNRVSLERDLREAVQAQQFLLYYQALVSDTGKVTGAEVLARWQHPVRGMVAPADFIPLAEETGIILPLGQWVLETACTQLAKWAVQPDMAHLTIAVNVSAHQFRQSDFVDHVLAVIKSTGANPHLLKLELTESSLVSNVEETIERMLLLKASGVGFALDDFGTGYSSLAYLKRLPLNHLKIDRSFVRDVLIDPNDASIAKAIVALAQSLGLGVIAEGVETQAQRDFLANSGCYAYQGFFFSRPLSVDGFEEYARRI